MKRPLLVFVGLILVVLGVLYVLQQHKVATAPSVPKPIPSPKPTVTQAITPTIAPTIALSNYCTSEDLTAQVSLSPAAGNIYGTLTLTNTSAQSCIIDGSNFIQPTSDAQNITISSQGTPGDAAITLAPKQAVYSEVHFPNGPQCNGPTQTDHIVFAYKISPQQSVTFVDQNGGAQQPITVCAAADQKTEVQVWSISYQQLP